MNQVVSEKRLRKRILFINPGPFGSLTDTYYYYIHLKEYYDITHVGFDEGKEVINYDNIRLIHLNGGSSGLSQKRLFFKKIRELLNSENFDFILINYFIGCSLIRLFRRKSVVVDVRSSYIFKNKYKRFLYNIILFFEVHFFRNITVISKGLSNFLHLPGRSHILPLGAPQFPLVKKKFDSLKILYVGTFCQRNIPNTIFAFAKFYREHNSKIPMSYTIIGYGSEDDVANIQTAIMTQEMKDHISYIGVIRYPKLNKYLHDHNVGMSYIPIKNHYEHQPPTKTFEYLLSGMAVIATGTSENKKVISDSNGVVINDSIEDIYNGLKEIYIRRLSYDTEKIQKNAKSYSWEEIVNGNLIPYIESFN
jgi:glycosyltransferase involved in cell wall biosynthesis